MRYFCLFVRTVIAVIFVCSGTIKLFSLQAFALTVGEFGIVLDELVMPVSFGVCIVEVIAGAGMLFGIRWCTWILSGLLLLLMGVLAYGIWIGLDIDCGCWGEGVHVKLQTQLIIDFLILAGLLWVVWTQLRPTAQSAVPTESK